ncbi:MAG: lysophospholipase [Symbiobacterium sp.]|uniref:lysophospholipase n=1 Tax=Symbiobacterium sp. TaxID=1971213 RepID=UPI00346389D4
MKERSGSLTGRGGLSLYYRVWEPEQATGSLVLVHGAGEHVGRYEHVAAWFAARGFAVWAMDHRGHGRSEGVRMHVDRFDDYLADLRGFVSLVTEASGRPVMIGHSMGGLIAYRYAASYPETISALVLSSPWFLSRAKVSRAEQALAPLLAVIAPRLQVKSGIPPEACTRNAERIALDQKDPLRCQTATPRWFVECTRAAAECRTAVIFPDGVPALFLVAGADQLVDPEVTRQVFDRIGYADKQFKLYPEKYHEIFNDPGYEEVFAEILSWLEAHGLAPRME